MSDLNVKVGYLTLNTLPGNQVVTGLGFKPKLVILASTKSQDNILYKGFSAFHSFSAVDTLLNHRLIYLTQRVDLYNDGGTPAGGENIYSLMDNASAIYLTDVPPTPTVQALGSITSMDNDGFTLNLSTAPATPYTLGYYALGGPAIQNVKVGSFISSGAGSQPVTGIGFQPDVIILFSQLTATDTTTRFSQFSHCLGMGNALAQFAQGSMSQKLSSASKYAATAADQGYIFLGIGNLDSSTGPNYQATLTSFNADGFTLNWLSHGASNVAISYIALKGTYFSQVGSFATPIPPNIGDEIHISTTFTPKSLFCFNPFVPALDHTTFITKTARAGIGFADDSLYNYATSINCGTPWNHLTQNGGASHGNLIDQLYLVGEGHSVSIVFDIDPARGTDYNDEIQNYLANEVKLFMRTVPVQTTYSGYLTLGEPPIINNNLIGQVGILN